MELYTSGVKVPKLGTHLDRLSREYLTHKSNREVAFAKLLAYSAAGSADEKITREINSIWRDYVNLSYFLEESSRAREASMMKEYESMKDIKLTAKSVGKGTDQHIVISGIPKEFYQ